MFTQIAPFTHAAQRILQWVTLAFITLTAMAMAAASALAAMGVIPWLTLPLTFGTTLFANAGVVIQLGLTALTTGLLFFLPSAVRVMRLETSHRDFKTSMDDVARAYHLSHAGDRTGAFTMSSEFDSIRDRIAHLSNHPDLGALEPQILELAAQMSHTSHDLAQTYSDENVTRAKTFLIQRQQEVARMEDRLDIARQTGGELKRWLTQVTLDEDVQDAQIARLRDDLAEVLPELGLPGSGTNEPEVVPLYNPPKTARIS